MLNLLYKDWIVGRGALLGIFFLLPFLTSMAIWVMVGDFGGIQLAVFTGIETVLILFLSFSLVIVDAGTQSENMLLSLPLQRSTYVFTRYISTFILVAINLLVAFFTVYFHRILFQLDDPALPIILNTKSLFLFYSGLLIMLAFIFPFMFKMGSGKGVVVAISIQLCIPLFKPFLKFLNNVFHGIYSFDVAELIQLFQSIARWISAQTNAEIIIFSMSILVSIIGISMVLSIFLYNRRDI